MKKKQSTLSIKHPEPLHRANKNKGGKLSKTKQLELRRANNAHHSTHCVMCDSNFETGERGYQRFPLKKRVNDEMDIAQVMEVCIQGLFYVITPFPVPQFGDLGMCGKHILFIIFRLD